MLAAVRLTVNSLVRTLQRPPKSECRLGIRICSHMFVARTKLVSRRVQQLRRPVLLCRSHRQMHHTKIPEVAQLAHEPMFLVPAYHWQIMPPLGYVPSQNDVNSPARTRRGGSQILSPEGSCISIQQAQSEIGTVREQQPVTLK